MYTQCLIAGTEQHFCCPDISTSVDDRFATMPVVNVALLAQPLSEEELHTSFEQAISDRLLIVNKQLSLKSGQAVYPRGAQRIQAHTEPLDQAATACLPVPEQQQSAALAPVSWRRRLILACLPCMFMLMGFDLMGLLTLHMR